MPDLRGRAIRQNIGGAWREPAKNLIIIGEPEASGSRPVVITTKLIQKIEKQRSFEPPPQTAARPPRGSYPSSFGISLSRRVERIIARRFWPTPLDLAYQLPRACPQASGAAGPPPAPVSVRRERLCMTLSIN